MKNVSLSRRSSALLNPRPAFGRSCVPAIFAACLACLAPSISRAAADTWTGAGADDFWQNPANWGGTAPLPNDALFFDGTLRLSPVNDFAAGTIFNSIVFNPGAGAFTLNGNSVVLTNGTDVTLGASSGGSITNSSPGNETINLPLTFSAGKHVLEADGGGQLLIGGPVTRNNGAVLVFSPFSGNINMTGSGLSNVNDILGGWAIVGNDWASLDASSNIVAYAGYTDVGSGAIANNPASNVRVINDTANPTAATGTIINSLLGQQSGARSVTITGTMKLGSRGGVYRNAMATGVFTVTGGTLTANGGGEITLADAPFNATGNNLTIASIIANDGAANVVSVNVVGYVIMSAANTFTGGTLIEQGRVQASSTSSFGTGPVTVYPGAEAFLNNNGTYANAFSIAGIGATETSGGQNLGAIRMNTGATTISGTVTLRDNARISGGSGGANVISGKITGPGRLELTAATGNNGSITLNNAANDWSGGLLITTANGRQVYLKLGADNQIPDGPGKGDVTIAGSDVGRFDLNGRSDTINGLVAGTNSNFQVANFGNTPSTLTFGGNNASAVFGGIIQDGGFATNSLSIVKIGTGTQTLAGINTYKGNTTVNAGSLIFGAAAGFPTAGTPTVTVNSNAILDITAVGPVTLAGTSAWSMSNGTVNLSPQASGNAVTVPTLTSSGATNFIGVDSIPSISTYPAQFPLIKYTTLNGTLNFGLAGSLPVSPAAPYAGYISNNAANGSVDLVITAGPPSIKWAGYSSGAPNSAWDTATPNFRTFGGVPATYSDGSFVLFDDSASNSIVSLSQTMSPAGITVSNSALTYILNDNGIGAFVTGAGGMNKLGPGTFIIDNSGANDFSGDVAISGGTLQIGNNDTFGSLPAAANVIDNATLAFFRSDDITFSTLISGSGGVRQNGTNILTLGVANTFAGTTTVSQGTLKVGNNGALGATNGATIVSSGATLDVGANTINIGQEPVTISGTGVGNGGALINSSGSATFSNPNLARLTLAGDATVGGSGRLDLRAATTSNPNLASLSTGGVPRKLTKVGANQFTIVGATVDPQLGDVEVQQGILGVETATTSLGNTASNLIVWPGATLELFALTNQLNKVISIGGDAVNASVLVQSAANTIIGPMTLTNDCLFNVINGTGISLTLSNVLTGTGILHKHNGTNTLFVSGNSPNFAGGVIVDLGTLNFSGILSNGLGVSVINGSKFLLNGTLRGLGVTNDATSIVAGSGSSAGPADISGSIIPGDAAIGTLTVGGLVLEGSSSMTFDLTATNTVGSGSNDLIAVNGDLVVNGGGVTINPIGLLQSGPTHPYTLFTYTGNLIWNADLVIPDVNTYHFVVDTNTAGKVNVVVSGGPPVWNGGSPSDNNWSDAANWGGVTITPSSALYFGGVNRLNNTNDTPANTTYGDIGFLPGAGAFVLNGNPIIPGSNIVNSSTSQQTVNPGVDFGSTLTLNGGSGGLIVGGGLTNTAAPLNTLTLAGTGTLTNLLASADPTGTNTISMTSSNANWTLMDNASSTPMTIPWTFDIRAGTFNFGSGSSAPSFSSITVNGQPQDQQVGVTTSNTATFNMNNGTLTTISRLNTATVNVSTGIVNQTGGTLNIGQQFQGANGGTSNALSILNVSGGTLNVGSATNPTGQIYVASRDQGIFTVSGSAIVNAGNLDVSRNANGNARGSIGTVNLNGGVLSVLRVGTALANSQSGPPSSGSLPAATFNFNGGVLKAKQTLTNFFQGNLAAPAIPIATIVKAGGAIVDDGGFSVGFLEPLQHDASLGATLDGGLKKLGGGTMTLGTVNTYSGATVVSNGTLAVNGSLGFSSVTVATNATIAGTGSVTNLAVSLGGTVSPAGFGTIGTLTVSNNANLQGIAVMEINRSANTNDVLKAASITFGGMLNVTNLSGTLMSGDSFKLFNANSYSGSIAIGSLPQLTPGLSWNTSNLNTTGIISITGTAQPPQIANASISGGNFVFTGSGGAPNGTYYVVSTNDIAIPRATWPRIATNTFDGSGNFTASIPIDPAQPNRYFSVQLP